LIKYNAKISSRDSVVRNFRIADIFLTTNNFKKDTLLAVWLIFLLCCEINTMEQKTLLTFNENGRAIIKTVDGVDMPAELSFQCVNEFVHSYDINFEDLQCLCLGLAAEIEKYKKLAT